MYCRKCAEEIPEGGSFCPNCGADQYNKSAVSNQSNTTSNAWGIWLTIGWICFAIALCLLTLQWAKLQDKGLKSGLQRRTGSRRWTQER